MTSRMDWKNWFGLNNGRLVGEPATWVDKTLAPGRTPIPKITWLQAAQRAPFVIITSPNFVWAAISLALYRFAPYDLTVTQPIAASFLISRLQIWLPLVLGYFGFWHAVSHLMAKRPYIDRNYSVDKVAHNVFWTVSGVGIWTLYENLFCYLWASGRLAYLSDAVSFGTWMGGARFLLALAAVPIWRNFHFYFAHRLLHFGPLYQQVHSLHHRNTDPEPFSGLCMHPVEHLYYFSCVAPSLVFLCSPYAFLWNGVHLLLSPAASHSGYEDHFQADLFHYLHHRFFECNYAGGDAAFLDVWFGTYRDTIESEPKTREDKKATLRTMPTAEFLTYLFLSLLCFRFGPVAAGFGPLALAPLVGAAFGSPQSINLTMANVLHMAVGTVFCALPVSYAISLAS